MAFFFSDSVVPPFSQSLGSSLHSTQSPPLLMFLWLLGQILLKIPLHNSVSDFPSAESFHHQLLISTVIQLLHCGPLGPGRPCNLQKSSENQHSVFALLRLAEGPGCLPTDSTPARNQQSRTVNLGLVSL